MKYIQNSITDRKPESNRFIKKDGISIRKASFGLEESNEIIAIHQVLSSPDIDEAAVSVDATGTQTKMAEQITDQGEHFSLPVKGNLPGLPDDLEHALSVGKGVTFLHQIIIF
jgi:hypothetical protein